MPGKHEVMASLRDTGVVAVIRTENPKDLVKVSRALAKGGVKFTEITMTVPGALDIIKDAVYQLKDEDVYIGAGTVLDAETARAVILAGAQYVVGPIFNPEMINLCNSYGVAVMPAGNTATEIYNAWKCGADVVKVFPAGVGGPGFFKDLKGPLPQIEIMPTGMVNLETAPKFIEAGAIAIGVGGALVGKPLIAAGDYDQITENARTFIKIVRDAREKK